MVPLRALILEDDQDIIDLIRSVLEPKIECCIATNGLEGLQMVEVAQPDFAICDIMMPVMDGTEFIKRVRQVPRNEGLPVIFLSALSAPDQIKRGYALGAALYLTKPIDPQRLRRNIEIFLQDHGIESRARRMSIEEVHQFGQVEEEITAKRHAPAAQPVAAAAAATATPAAPPTPAPAVKESMAAGFATLQRIKAMKNEDQKKDRVRILLVEDDRDTCQLVRMALADQYDLMETNDGITAIEFAVRYKPDLFIIDGMLPRMTGYQLAVMLKKNRDFWRSPIVFMSGKATQRDQQYVQKLGISMFLAKPFTVAAIQNTVRVIVETPGFTMKHDRLPFSQVHLEQFQNFETHRTARTSLEQIERGGLESALKKQLS